MLEYSYHREPNPHIYFPELLPPDLYEQVRFPDIEVRSKGRSGRDLFMGEPGYDEAVSSPGLRELHGMLTSEQFVRWVMSIFAADLPRLGCRADADRIRLIPFLETRDVLDAAPEVLDESADPSEVFNRFDFSIGGPDYTAYAHLDSPRRIVGGVLFFSDAARDGIDGGEFVLYRDWLFLGDRVVRWPHAAKVLPLRGNTGVMFLNSNRGYHGPNAVRSGVRRWIYYSISSRNRAWLPERPSLARALPLKVANRVVRRVGHPIPQNPKSKLDANVSGR